MKIEIKQRLSGEVLYSIEAESVKEAVEAAVKAGVSLDFAALNHTSLEGAILDRASLNWASLEETILDGASLKKASLRWALLKGTSLRRAVLDEALLDGATLDGVILDGTSFEGASLRWATLKGDSLVNASLTPIRDDLWVILSSSPAEVAGLRQALIDGKVDGSTYQGSCACLVGTIANLRHCRYTEIPGLKPDAERPAERFFTAIKKDDIPSTSPFSQLAVVWIDEWLKAKETT